MIDVEGISFGKGMKNCCCNSPYISAELEEAKVCDKGTGVI
jgi:hypothetical protein